MTLLRYLASPFLSYRRLGHRRRHLKSSMSEYGRYRNYPGPRCRHSTYYRRFPRRRLRHPLCRRHHRLPRHLHPHRRPYRRRQRRRRLKRKRHRFLMSLMNRE